jgi:hypothetical protein
MKILGIILSAFGSLMVLSSLNLVRLGKFNLSTTEGIQQFAGGTGFGVIAFALGLWLFTRKSGTRPPRLPD